MAEYKLVQIKRKPGPAGLFDVVVEGPEAIEETIRYRDIEPHLSAHSGRDDDYSRAALALWSEINRAFPSRRASLGALQAFAERTECRDILDGKVDRANAWETLFGETNVAFEGDAYGSTAAVLEEEGAEPDEMSGLRTQAEKEEASAPDADEEGNGGGRQTRSRGRNS